ncbi:MAG: glucosamine-6-phosphate deaminase [Frankiales bacterium]|nr:glucosamine-6-phosphate deaminase [Frankiales bacterium]
MEVVIVPSASVVADVAAEAVLGGLPADRPPVLGLATGSSPMGLYDRLAAAAADGRLRCHDLSGVALDEYVGLPPGHPQSYRAVLERTVCEPVGLRRERLHVPDGSGACLAALEAGALRFERTVAGLGGVDVQVLGIGANGHLGFNEPGSALSSRTRVKRLSDRTRADNARFFGAPQDVPTHCVTQGLGTILEARRLVLVATGTAKAAAVAAALEGPLTASCPASVLQWHADAVAVLDEDAAALLRNRAYYDASARGLRLPG